MTTFSPRSATAPPPPAAPRLLALVSVGVLAVGVAVVVAGAWRIGVTTDETFHVARLRNYLGCGWYLTDAELSGCRVGEGVADAYVYAPVTTLVMHAVNLVVGHDGAATVDAGWAAYRVRHLVVAVISLAGVAATMDIVRRLTDRASWSLVAGAVLVAMPPWTGHGMFNPKDVPVATGYTLVTAGLIAILRDERGSTGRRLVGPAMLLAGLVLALGTRPGIWVGLAGSVLVALAACAGPRIGGAGRRRWRVLEMAVPVVVAYAALLAVYPSVFGDPGWPLASARGSADYNGVSGSALYVPVNLIAEVPELLLLVVLLAVAELSGWLRRWRLAPRAVAVTLVLMQCVVLPVGAALAGSYLYTGLRQLLFIFPALAVLVTLQLRRWSTGRTPTITRVPVVVSVAAIVLPTVVQVQLFPYGYAFTSPVFLRLGGVDDGDYWRASLAEVAPALPEDSFTICGPATVGDVTLRVRRDTARALPEISRDCRTDELSLLSIYRTWTPPAVAPVAPTWTAVFSTSGSVGRNCTVTRQIDRRALWTPVTLAAVATCDLELVAMPPGGVAYDGSLESSRTLLGGWTSPEGDGAAVVLLGVAGSLGVDLGAEVATPLRVDLDLRGAVSAVLVNNTVVAGPGEWDGQRSLLVDAPVARAMGDGRVVVTVVRRSGGDDVRLRRIEVSPR